MSRFLLGGVIAAAFTASMPLFAQGAPSATVSQPVAAPGSANRMQRHAKAPKSRAEVQAGVARHFSRMDSDRDGFVTKAEADALQAKRGERFEQRAAKRGERSQERAEKRAGRFDPATMFARLDGNKDGTISRAEAEAARTARAAEKGKPAKAHAMAFGGLFERADSNRDGNISRAEFDAAAPKGGMRGGKRGGQRHAGMKPGRGDHFFTMGDANKDGRVSLAEAQQAALSHFDRQDLNRDGQITPEERRQGREQRRAQRQPG